MLSKPQTNLAVYKFIYAINDYELLISLWTKDECSFSDKILKSIETTQIILFLSIHGTIKTCDVTNFVR